MERTRSWRRIGWVAGLSLLAATGGVVSEVVAQSFTTRFRVPRNANWVQALWNINTPTVSGSVWTAASSAVDFESEPDGQFAAAAGTYFVPARGRVESVWGGGLFQGSLLQGRGLIDTRLVNAVFPVNFASFDNGAWDTSTVNVRVNLAEQKGRSRIENGPTHLFFANQFSSADWSLNGTSPASVVGTGDFTVLPATGSPFPLVVPNTPISTGDYGKATSGSGSFTSIFEQVTNAGR